MAARIGSKLVSVILAVGCFAASSGCHSYRAIAPDGASPGITVRAHLTPPGVARLTVTLGDARSTVEGQVVEATGRELHLLSRHESTNRFENGLGSAYLQYLQQRIIIGRDEIQGIEERVLDRRKTAAVTTVLVGALTGLFVHFMWGDSKGGILDETGDEVIY